MEFLRKSFSFVKQIEFESVEFQLDNEYISRIRQIYERILIFHGCIILGSRSFTCTRNFGYINFTNFSGTNERQFQKRMEEN